MIKGLLLSGAVLMFVSGAAAVAHADTFTFTDGLGAKYALDDTSLGGGKFDMFLTIDTTGVSGADTLGDVAIKTASGSISNLSFISAPSGYPSAGFQTGGLGNSGCDGNGNGFVCFAGSAPVGGAGDVYTFEWSFTGSLPDPGHVKDQFFLDGDKVEQLSQDITVGTHSTPPATPEPSSLMLLGTGALGLAGVVRRRFGR